MENKNNRWQVAVFSLIATSLFWVTIFSVTPVGAGEQEEQYQEVDPKELSFTIKDYHHRCVLDEDGGKPIEGEIGTLICDGKSVELLSNKFEDGYIITKEFGKIKIRFSASLMRTGFSIWLTPSQKNALKEFTLRKKKAEETSISAAAAPVSRAAGEKSERPATSQAVAPSTVVARIGPYTITREELEKQLLMDLRPSDYDYYDEDARPADAMSTLVKMVGEKAMVLDARAKGMLEDEQTQRTVKRSRQKELASLLGRTFNQSKVVVVSESEIAAKMKSDPRLDEATAKKVVENSKRRALGNQYYLEIYRKLHVKIQRENFSKVSQVHQRLLRRPIAPRPQSWIKNSQVREELTPVEKGIVLATYDKGQITLEDWLNTLCEVVPPRRPKTADEKVVDQYLAAALQMPLLVTEAESLGLHRNAEFLKQVRDYEDRLLLGQANAARYKDANEPTTEQMVAYFNENKETFGTSKSLKIDQIWCDDLAAAKKVRAELDAGKDFEQVKQQYSLEKKLKAFNTQPGSEAIFWKDLWVADPNAIVGPVKGFYQQGVKWRVVKVLEKKPAESKEYNEQMLPRIKDRMMTRQREALLAASRKKLLEKYTHQIYAEKVKEIDVLDID